MKNWYPILEEIDEVNTPDTEMVQLEEDEGVDVPRTWSYEEVKEAVENVGGTPAFIRTDAASNKHFMYKSSRLPNLDEDTIDSHIGEVIFHNVSAGFAGLPFDRLFIREWLDLAHEFKAFGQTPIAQELRFFIHNGEILGYHFYWPKDSIKFFHNTEKPDDWEDQWIETRNEALGHAQFAKKQAQIIADKFRGQGFWSLDFARVESGEWYAIDMARGEISWHPKVAGFDKAMMTVTDYENLYSDSERKTENSDS